MKRLGLILGLAGLLFGAELFACTTVIVSAEASASGRPMIWKQRDAGNIHNCLVFRDGPVYDFTAVIPVGAEKRKVAYAGVNTAGFAIANNLSYNLEETDPEKDPRNGLFMHLALGQCGSLADFEKLLRERPDSIKISANFAVIDAYGGAAYFEAGEKGWVRYDVPRGGILYRTNFSLSGKKDVGGGYARWEAIQKIMGRKAPRGGYDAGYFTEISRWFYDGVNGKDALRSSGDYLLDRNFIPRTSSASSVVIEGVTAGDRPDGGMMWFTAGYPPCCYAVAAWVAAGAELPGCISGEAPANALAVELMHRTHPLSWEGGDDYLDVKALKKITPLVRKAEKAEMKAARAVAESFRRDGFDLQALKRYNSDADTRFAAFKAQF